MASTAITINQEYANLVPPLSAEEYEGLKQSIKQNGLWIPITVNNQGVILDGHHRFKACQELGIEPKTMTKDFADKLHEQMFVIDSNLRRRHLNNFQRTELALKSKSILQEIAKKNSQANLKQQQRHAPSDRNLTVGSSSGGGGGVGIGAGGRVDEQIAKLAGVSRDTVRKVEAIQKAVEQNPQRKCIIDKLDSGEISVNEADQIIKASEEDDDDDGVIPEENVMSGSISPEQAEFTRSQQETWKALRYLIGRLSGLRTYDEQRAVASTNRELVEKTDAHRLKIIKQENDMDLRETHGLSQRLSYLLNRFLQQLDDEIDLKKAKAAMEGA
jgi:ParB-like nuclease domain